MSESPEQTAAPRPGIRFIPVSGLSGRDRRLAAEALLPVLADLHMLWLKAHAAHWNAAGPMFRAVHAQTEELYTGVAEQFDLVAERIRALGIRVPASLEAMQDLTSIPDDEDAPETTAAMVAQLLRDIGIFCQTLREAADDADDADDEASEGLLAELLAFHEKQAWMLQMLVADDGPGVPLDLDEDEDEDGDEDEDDDGDDDGDDVEDEDGDEDEDDDEGDDDEADDDEGDDDEADDDEGDGDEAEKGRAGAEEALARAHGAAPPERSAA
jgi:starvation-inducible DNA-binding protein